MGATSEASDLILSVDIDAGVCSSHCRCAVAWPSYRRTRSCLAGLSGKLVRFDAILAKSLSDNIDPTNSHTDEQLNKIVNLVHTNSGNSNTFSDKFKLDATVLNEGTNFSAGERQLCMSNQHRKLWDSG